MAKQKLIEEKQRNTVIIDMCKMIIGGLPKSEIIAKIREDNPTLSEITCRKSFDVAMSSIKNKTAKNAEEIIDSHVAWYERIFYKFESLGCIPGKNATLRQKERILGLLKEDRIMSIENEVNIGVNNQPEYDLSKLTLEERKRVEGYLKKIKETKVTYDLELETKKRVYEESYHEFFMFCFKALYPNEAYEDNFHIKYICDLLQKEAERVLRKEERTQDIIINVPPRSSKSLLISVCFLPWVWIKNPTATFICISFDEDLSNVNSRLSRDIIRLDEYQKMFGDRYKMRKDVDGVEMYQNNKGGFRISKTTGSNITGHKGLFICWDDLQNPKTAESKIERKKVVGYYRNSLFNRLTPITLGVRIGVMQRLHEEDLTGDLLKKSPDTYNHICLPAEDSADVKPIHLRAFYKDGLLDPRRLSRKTLAEFKSTLGTRGYAGQYAQRPSPEEGGILKKEWFDIVSPEILTRDVINEPIHFFIDSAYTEKTTNDPTAIFTCFKKNGVIYVLDVTQVWMEFPDLIKYLKKHTSKYQLSSDSKIFIEPKASGVSLAQTLRSETGLNIIETKAPDTDKVVRANAASPKMESRRVKLVAGMYIEDYLNQLAAFPNGSHDDMVDTTVMAIDTLLPANDNPDFLFV